MGKTLINQQVTKVTSLDPEQIKKESTTEESNEILLDDTFSKLVKKEIIEDGEGATVTLHYDNYKATFAEDQQYATRLAAILESPRIKEELGEQTLWHYEDKRGFLKKKMVQYAMITNYRVIYFHLDHGELVQLPLKYAEIVVNNTKSLSQRNGSGVGAWDPKFAVGIGFYQSHGVSTRVGDLWFLFQGQKVIELNKVHDPNGIKRTLETIKKQIHNNEGNR
jgi:hypothetical protein